MAPEQLGRMNGPIDARCNLYSLGVILYQMLVGELPFAASDPMEWIHCHIAMQPHPPSARFAEIPRALDVIVLKLLAKDPADRYQTAAGVESDLRHCVSECEQRHQDGMKVSHPMLRSLPEAASANEATTGQLDQAAIVEISRVLSGEIVLDRLVEKIVAIAVEHTAPTAPHERQV